MTTVRSRLPFLLVLGCAALATACVTIFHRLDIEPVQASPTPQVTRSPLRAHLRDGSIVVFRSGATVGDTVIGPGERFDLAAQPVGRVDRIPLDSVVGMEVFRDRVLPVETTLGTVLATAGGVVLGAAAAVAIFGSCPTVYAQSAGTYQLEAESFSYSIVPLFEARDVDRLRAVQEVGGTVELEVRNEALETHQLNHFELLSVEHAPEEAAHVTGDGSVLVVSRPSAPLSVRDRAGRDVLRQIMSEDELVYETPPAVTLRAKQNDLWDYIDVTMMVQPGVDSVALLLRSRNSLLTTVLFYETMLARSGAGALDWLGSDMERLGTATELGRWYASRLGLRISYPDEGDDSDPVLRVADPGPIAWKDLALTVATHGRERVRVRLSFVVDAWRIDRIAVGGAFRRPLVRTHSAARVIGSDAREDTSALAALALPDERYLRTTPGQRFGLQFELNQPPGDRVRTYFLAAQGYYTEWIRPDWIRSATVASTFQPSDESLLQALSSWTQQRTTLEQRFQSTRIPVR